MTYAVTLTTCPAISLPCGFTKAGLPVGIQIVGGRGRDEEVIAISAAFEKVFGVHAQVPIDVHEKEEDQEAETRKIEGKRTIAEAAEHHGITYR